MTEAAIQTRYRVDGMDCAGCATKIDTAVRRLPGIVDVTVSVAAAAMTVRHGAGADLAMVQRKVTGLGYGVAPLTAGTSALRSPRAANKGAGVTAMLMAGRLASGGKAARAG